MKLLVFVLSSVFVAQTQAQVSVARSASSSMNSEKAWTAEAVLTTAANSSSPTFGPAILYSADSRNQFGVRFTSPIGAADSGTVSAAALYRYYFGENKTNLFGEASLADNWYYFGNQGSAVTAPSIGTNVGIVHHLSEDISFGGTAGIDWTRTYISRDYAASDSSTLYAWGRVSLFGSLSF
jgi:hypothetical protein